MIITGKKTKLEVIAGIESTTGTTPEEALTKAMAAEVPDTTRLYSRDYIPALKILIGKGYTGKAASEYLTASGVPFTPETLYKSYMRHVVRNKRPENVERVGA